MTARLVIALVAVAALVAFTGCGTSGDARESRAVVERFYDALRQDDGSAACAQLSAPAMQALESQSGQSCESAVTRLDYEGGAIERTQVFITSARVDLRGGESAFLDREPGLGWRISAVACRAQEGPPSKQPMDCEVEA
jgi:hypothetical protein